MARRPWAAAWVLAACAHFAPTVAAAEPAATVTVLPAGPGSVRGLADEASLDVFTGQVSYAIPLELPAAAAGFAPQLGLGYHGALGNGPLGVGWSLSVPSIVRSLRHGVPTYAADDEIELQGLAGGGRLVAAGDGTYRIEGHGQQVRVTGSAEAGFVLDDGAGTRYHFGARARRAAGARVAAWLLDSVEDAAGQRADYAYLARDGETYLQNITWGGAAALRLDLEYERRPDVTRSFRTGFEVRLAWRLRTLRVAAYGEERQAYHLCYDASHQLSRLRQVRMTGRGGTGALPPTTLSYATSEPPRVFALGNTQRWYVGGRGALLVDLDADGAIDFVQMETGRLKRNLGGAFDDADSTSGLTMGAAAEGRFVDLDGDGVQELAYEYDAYGWRVRRLVGYRWENVGTWPGTAGVGLKGDGNLLVDVNGDGIVDHLRALEGRMQVRLGSRDGFAAPRTVPPLPTANASPHSDAARWVDVNGDGLVDVWALGDGDAHLYLGCGDGTFRDEGRFPYPWDGPNQQPLDRMHLADLDRDGFADLIVASHGHVTWFRGQPSGGWSRAAQRLAAPAAGDTVTIGDINGNGSQDVVWGSGWAADLAGPTTAGMLVAVDNGLGQVTRFGYRSSTELSLAAAARGAPWSRHLAAAIPVCVRIAHEVAGSATRTIRYDVTDALWDAEERRFGGFLVARRTRGDDGPDALVEETHFHAGSGDDRVLRGRPVAILQQARGAARPLQRLDSTWAAAQVTGLDGSRERLLRLPLLQGERTTHYADDGATAETAISYAYDGEGNPAWVRHHGRVDRDGDEAEVRRTFTASDEPWVRGVLVEESMADAGGHVLERTRHAYDGGADPLPLGHVAAGRLRRVEHYFAEEDRWVIHAERDYDAHGNVVRMLDEGRERRVTYDELGRHPVREALRTGPDTELVWSLAWDRVLGTPQRFTSPDGRIERVAYDALARPVSRAHGDEAPHTEYAYHWDAPQSRTVTRLHDGPAGERERVDLADGAGRARLSAWRLDAEHWQVEGHWRHDVRGQVAAVAQPYVTAGLSDEDLAAAAPAWRRFSYDALGRLVATELPDGTVRSVAYHLLDEEVREPELAAVHYRRDGLGRTVRTERVVGLQREVADATYDALGRLIRLALQDGAAVHTYRYDSLGRLVASDDSDSGARRLRYNDAGWLVARTNGAGDETTYAYDAAGRVTARRGSGQAHAYHYDVPRDAGFARTAGRLAWVQDPSGETHFSYDAGGNLGHILRRIGGDSASRTLLHSPLGTLLRATTDDGVVLDYTYDALGRPTRVGDLWRATAYGPAGGLLTEQYGNGLRQSFTRNLLDLPVNTELASPSATLLALKATYTPFGAPRDITDTDGRGRDHSASFAYDGAARLSAAAIAGFAFGYEYDGLGNLVARHVEGPRPLNMLAGPYEHGAAASAGSFTLDCGPRQLRAAGGETFAYDGAGRMVRAGARQMRYDAFDRMVGATLASGEEVAYTYGYDGERAVTAAADGVTYAFFPNMVQRHGVREHRVSIGGRTVARIDVAQRSGAAPRITYLHAALGGAATLVTDAAGTILDERRFEPFGASIDADFAVDPHGSADKRRDGRTGWVDHGARWSAPQLAQWLVPDPPVTGLTAAIMASPWDAHPYQHVRHNPLLYGDPDGRHPVIAAAVRLVVRGGLSAAGFEAARELYVGEDLDGRSISSSAAGGAVAAGVAGVTGGGGLMLGMGAAATNGAMSGLAERAVRGEEFSAEATAHDAAIGVVNKGVGYLMPVLGSAWRRAVAWSHASAKSIFLHQRYLASLRKLMEKPLFDDPGLQRHANVFFRRAATIGNGSATAAHRIEVKYGVRIRGRLHREKVQNTIIYFRKWLADPLNNEASRRDRANVENLLLDAEKAIRDFS